MNRVQRVNNFAIGNDAAMAYALLQCSNAVFALFHERLRIDSPVSGSKPILVFCPAG